MGWLDEALPGWGTTVLVGIGVAVAAPVLLPALGAIVRPVAKGVIKGGFYLADSLQEVIAEGGEQLSDLIAEVQAERTAANAAHATTFTNTTGK